MTTTTQSQAQRSRNPQWWTDKHDSAWERVKAAFKRDWDQTKHDFGGDEPDTDQDVNNTVAQAAGRETIPPRGQPTYEDTESAYRFGYGARSHYGERYTTWDDKLETQLQRDWEDITPPENRRQWSQYRKAVRRGWDYQPRS